MKSEEWKDGKWKISVQVSEKEREQELGEFDKALGRCENRLILR